LYREFGLPIINWKKTWFRSAPEGIFLIDLGLREYPTLKTILELAASSEPTIREKALKYFIDNFNEKYSRSYDPAKTKVAFLPCLSPGSYAKPLECFINPECTIMNFQAVRQDLRFKVPQLGVRQYPSIEELKSMLTNSPPQDVNKAKEIFEFLASQRGSFNWTILASYNFIPIEDKTRPSGINRTNPRNCYLNRFDQEECLNDFFTFIDFGEKANKFLESCGVRTKPSSVEIAELLVKSSRNIWKSIGKYETYLYILNRIAADYRYTIINQPNLFEKMKKAPILAAIKHDGNNIEYQLTSANNIFINDDEAYQKVFKPLIAPDNDNLKTMYK
ncbi:16425_t:CDS:2, partial [Funneliformis caledonium]